MRRSRTFCQRGFNFENVFFVFVVVFGGGFFVDEGIYDPNITINGPSLARQRNVI